MTARQILLDERAEALDAVLDRAARAATGLAALGVREGDCIALLMRNDFAFIEATQAAALVGAYAVPINWHGRPDEVRYILEDARPRLLIAHADLLRPLLESAPGTADAQQATRAGEASQGHAGSPVGDRLPAGLQVLTVRTPPEVRQRFDLGGEGLEADAQATVGPSAPGSTRPPASSDRQAGAAQPGTGEAWDTWCQRHAPWTAPPRPLRATLIYTSGTTGKPKGVMRQAATPEQAQALVETLRGVFGLRPGARALVAGPLYHSSPNAFMRQALRVADLLAMQTRFDPEATLATIARHRITHAMMVPTMFIRLLRLPREVRERYDVSSLQWVVHTAAPCPVDIKRALMDWWGPIVYETYGGTEVGTATVCTPQDWLAHPGTVGRPVPGARIALYGEDGRPVAPGEVGEIYMRVPSYADFTYVNDPAKRAAVERDSLISCGDVGYLRDGLLYLCDRRADMVISAGVNIYPAEIEAVLQSCPGVRDCAVFGIPDEEFGEALLAIVEPAPGATIDATTVRQYLAARLARYKVPRRIEFQDALPREESGKIFKRKLRDPYWQGAGRRI